jgi:hypothetical protein
MSRLSCNQIDVIGHSGASETMVHKFDARLAPRHRSETAPLYTTIGRTHPIPRVVSRRFWPRGKIDLVEVVSGLVGVAKQVLLAGEFFQPRYDGRLLHRPLLVSRPEFPAAGLSVMFLKEHYGAHQKLNWLVGSFLASVSAFRARPV